MKVAHNDLKKATDVLPPAIETYEVSHEGKVLTSPYHGENEVKENKRLAGFIANKIGKKSICFHDLILAIQNKHLCVLRCFLKECLTERIQISSLAECCLMERA